MKFQIASADRNEVYTAERGLSEKGQVSLLSKVNKGTTVICRFPIDGPVSGGKSVRRAHAEASRIRQAS